MRQTRWTTFSRDFAEANFGDAVTRARYLANDRHSLVLSVAFPASIPFFLHRWLSLHRGVMSFRRGGYLALRIPDLTTRVLIAAECGVMDLALKRGHGYANI